MCRKGTIRLEGEKRGVQPPELLKQAEGKEGRDRESEKSDATKARCTQFYTCHPNTSATATATATTAAAAAAAAAATAAMRLQ